MTLSAPIHRLRRRAKLLARDEKIALHEALDRIARAEGFKAWSLLMREAALSSPSKAVLPQLANGDLLLIAARPGQGKTMFGLQLLLDAVRAGRRAVFFTLEYSERETRKRLILLEGKSREAGYPLETVVSDDISADFIARYLADAPGGTVAVIDYLQILDQRRDTPPLADQMRVLRRFANQTGVIFGLLSQIRRDFDPNCEALPGVKDIRLPNPIEIGLFSKACFLHGGDVRFQDLA